MSAIDSKFHIKIGDFGFLIAKQARTERHQYTRQEAPAFVNKFSSGEPNYRDSTFFPHWVQLNWLNGFDQEFFDDGGKYWRSVGVDPTKQTQLTLEKKFSSAGLVSSGYKVNTQQAWRASQSWWDTNYSYRKQLTISAPSGNAVPANYPIVITEDTAALQTAGKVLSNRNDWRVVFWNGTSWQDLTRHYVSTTVTLFSLQEALDAGATNNNYYIYYGYSGASDNKQPTTDAEWLEIYSFYGTTLDSNTLAMWAFKDGSGATVTDLKNNYDLTMFSDYSWVSSPAKFGFWGDFGTNGGAKYVDSGNIFNLGSVSVECLVNITSTGGTQIIAHKRSVTTDTDASYWHLSISSGKLQWGLTSGAVEITCPTGIHWLQGTFDGSSTAKLYVDGVLQGTNTSCAEASATSNQGVYVGGKDLGGHDVFQGQLALMRISNIARSSFTYVLANSPSYTAGSETSTQPLSSSFTHIVGADDGKIYSWDGIDTFTELFDCRRVSWYESGYDADKVVGDTGGTETAQSQSFKVDQNIKCKGIEAYLKAAAGTPGDITVRIETDSSGKPSGTLVDAAATATITAFAETDYAWKSVDFTDTFQLNSGTVYHLVLKTAAAANDNNYNWAADASSPSYTDGNMCASTDGGSTWSSVTGADAYFRVKGDSTKVNCSLVSSVGGNQKAYFGVGDIDGTEAGEGRLYAYDGTTFELINIFTGANDSCVLSLAEYGSTTSKVYIGMGARARIYESSDMSTFTESKVITQPNGPGYVLSMKEYQGRLFAGGGFPEQLHGNTYQYSGFLYAYDEYTWTNLFPMDHTVVTSLETFDSLLFIGTIHKRLYVFNTASVDKLFEFPWDVQISSMIKFDDKLALAISPTPGKGQSGYEGVYLFDRNGFHNAFYIDSKSWYSVFVFNNNLMVSDGDGYIYQTNSANYAADGWVQSSYDEASLPSIYKIRRDVTLMYSSLPAGTSIAVYYKTDESDTSWILLGTASTEDSTEETFNFPDGIYSKKISFKCVLSTTDTTKTPTLKKIIHKYLLSPDFKYMWKIKLLCADNIIWIDGTEPAGIVGSAITAGDTTITLKSSDDSTPTAGFPDPNGSTAYASIVDQSTGQAYQFSYTGKTDTTLTGIPATGTYALADHNVNDKIMIRAMDIHQVILDLKQTRQLFTFTDVDGITHDAYFHSYQADTWVINQDNWEGGLENEVPITLLEA